MLATTNRFSVIDKGSDTQTLIDTTLPQNVADEICAADMDHLRKPLAKVKYPPAVACFLLGLAHAHGVKFMRIAASQDCDLHPGGAMKSCTDGKKHSIRRVFCLSRCWRSRCGNQSLCATDSVSRYWKSRPSEAGCHPSPLSSSLAHA